MDTLKRRSKTSSALPGGVFNPHFLSVLMVVFLIAGTCQGVVNQTKAQPSEAPRFFYKGLLISDCTIPGERKSDNVQPSNAICGQLRKDRYMWIYITTSFQGADSVRAVVYQIRKDTPDGPVLKEGLVSPFTDQWDPFNTGDKYFRQQGHNKFFGVPQGAADKNGQLLLSQNVFCATWYQFPRLIDPQTGRLLNTTDERSEKYDIRLASRQFKLNEAGDNIEFLTPITTLRQKGFEEGDIFCELGAAVTGYNQWYVPFEPYNEARTQWVDYWHFSPLGMSAVMMEFNPQTGLYEWVKTGPRANMKGTECSLSKLGDEWIILSKQATWFKTKDLFAPLGKATLSKGGPSANQSAYVFGDGVLRVFGGSGDLSPFQWVRNPQYCWDVDPHSFQLSNCKTVLSTDDIDMVATRSVKFRTFLSPVFQNRQIATMTVSKEITGKPTPKEMDTFGVHYWYITYDKAFKGEWNFAE